jgi:hypothetical protein
MQTLLVQHRNPNLRAYFIWGPYLRTDSVESARASTQRFLAPNAAYYWTATPSLGQELGSVLRLAGGRLAWDVYLLYRKEILWESRLPEPTYWQQQLDVVQADTLDIIKMEQRIQQLLTQR